MPFSLLCPFSCGFLHWWIHKGWERPDGLGYRQSVWDNNGFSIVRVGMWENIWGFLMKPLTGELGFCFWALSYQGKSNSRLCLKACKENSTWYISFPCSLDTQPSCPEQKLLGFKHLQRSSFFLQAINRNASWVASHFLNSVALAGNHKNSFGTC